MNHDRTMALDLQVRHLSAIVAKQAARIAALEKALHPSVQKTLVAVVARDAAEPFRARMAEIAEAVATLYGCSVAELKGPSPRRSVAWPRQDAMRLMNHLGFSSAQIGRFFNRDHTTVLHGIRASTQRMEEGDSQQKQVLSLWISQKNCDPAYSKM